METVASLGARTSTSNQSATWRAETITVYPLGREIYCCWCSSGCWLLYIAIKLPSSTDWNIAPSYFQLLIDTHDSGTSRGSLIFPSSEWLAWIKQGWWLIPKLDISGTTPNLMAHLLKPLQEPFLIPKPQSHTQEPEEILSFSDAVLFLRFE